MMAVAHARWVVSDALTLDVFSAEFDVAQFRTAFFAAAGIACPERVGRSVPKRQAEFFHGRLCARAALAAAGSACGDVGVGAQGEPVWPAGCTGSISHAAGIAVAAVVPGSARAGFGIDVEEIAKDATLTALLQTTMTAPERALLVRRAGPESTAALATAAFSAKESFYKAVFPRVRRYVEFDALLLEEIDPAAGRMRLQLRETLHGTLVRGMPVEASFKWLPARRVVSACIS